MNKYQIDGEGKGARANPDKNRNESATKFVKLLSIVLFGGALMTTLPACEKEGPIEEAGEEVEEGVEDAGDAVKDATN